MPRWRRFMRSACKIIILLGWFFLFMRDGMPGQVGPFDTKQECKAGEEKIMKRSTALVPYRILIDEIRLSKRCWT